jgi:hypothetical protein
MYHPVPLNIRVARCVTTSHASLCFTMRRLNKNFIMNRAICILIIYHMQITGVVGILVGLSIILFEVFPEESVWSIPVRQADEHMIAVPTSGGLTLLLGQKQEAYKTLTKEQQRFRKTM